MKITKKELIFTSAPFSECHASSLAVGYDGSLLCAWFGGEKEGADDVRIWFSRRANGVWSPPRAIPSTEPLPHWNPVLFNLSGREIALYYKVGRTIPDWKTYFTVTDDLGESWSTPRELVEGDDSGGRGPVKNKCLLASDGAILAPASVERGPWRCFIDRFDGKSWEKHPIPVENNGDRELHLIQPTLWESDSGTIHALMRSRNGYIYRSDSVDHGKSWSAAYPTSIPNNNSGIDCVGIGDGVVLVCNPVSSGRRTPLSLLLSRGGEHFEKVLDLEVSEGEFSYPATVVGNGRIHVTYTYKRQSIAYCEIEL